MTLRRNEISNIPNKLTIGRIFLVPLLVALLLSNLKHGDLWAAVVFSIAASMDGLDGYLARLHKSETVLGKFLDPLADKILISAALISLVEIGRLSTWVVIIIISREFAVTALRLAAFTHGEVIAAGILGKIKTATQITAIMALILISSSVLKDILVALMVIITIMSGLDYFIRAKRYLDSPQIDSAASIPDD